MKSNFVTMGLISLALAACSGGENGLDGKDGKDGASCTITNNEDGTATITCPDGSSFTIKNGEDGKKGDAGSDGEKGQNGQSCKLVENINGSQAVVCPYDGSSYIVRGNTDHYVNYCAPGFYGKNCENECNCPEHSNCNDGVTGDGSCSCIDAWSDEDCSVCPAGFYDGVTDCFDCRKGAAFGTEKCTFTDTSNGQNTTYKVVTINNQLWMAENLKNSSVDHYSVNKDSNNDDTYGFLYTYEDAMKACPSGWRLPTKIDFNNLLTYVTNNRTASSNFLALIKKSTAWTNYSKDGVDDFGFGALPAGGYYSYYYNYFGYNGYFWSSAEIDSSYAYGLYLGNGSALVVSNDKTYGYSVRCLRDSN